MVCVFNQAKGEDYAMLTWNEFLPFAAAASSLWLAGALSAMLPMGWSRKASISLISMGIVVYGCFVIGLWVGLGRPPLRTMGETRLWYSLFMMVSALTVYVRWGYRWLPFFSFVVSSAFVTVNVLHPELHDRSLPPALQSGWFVPHVTVYMFSYSLFGCAFLLALAGLFRRRVEYLPSADRLVGVGLAFLTFGMLSGCIWAKQAWGTYWSWDPKEAWAAATWCAYLAYVHYRLRHPSPERKVVPYLMLLVGFLLLQMCWYGINFLPSAKGSLHSY